MILYLQHDLWRRCPLYPDGLARSDSVQCGQDIVHHASSVAARCVADEYAVLPAIIHVDVVRADGRRSYDADRRAGQHVRAAAGPGTDDQRICIDDVFMADILALEIDDVGVGLEDTLDERDHAVDNDFHGLFQNEFSHVGNPGIVLDEKFVPGQYEVDPVHQFGALEGQMVAYNGGIEGDVQFPVAEKAFQGIAGRPGRLVPCREDTVGVEPGGEFHRLDIQRDKLLHRHCPLAGDAYRTLLLHVTPPSW